MKKTYIIPEIQTDELSMDIQLLAGSPELTGTYSGGVVLGRESGDFDDEEE